MTDKRKEEIKPNAFFLREEINDYETTIHICQRMENKGQPAMRYVADFDGFDKNLAQVALDALNGTTTVISPPPSDIDRGEG